MLKMLRNRPRANTQEMANRDAGQALTKKLQDLVLPRREGERFSLPDMLWARSGVTIRQFQKTQHRL